MDKKNTLKNKESKKQKLRTGIKKPTSTHEMGCKKIFNFLESISKAQLSRSNRLSTIS